MKVFAIFDSKAGAFLQPFFSPTNATAVRSFGTAANDASTDFSRYASDYTLFEIGSWDAEAGDLVPLEAKVALGTALEYKSLAEVAQLAPVRSE